MHILLKLLRLCKLQYQAQHIGLWAARDNKNNDFTVVWYNLWIIETNEETHLYLSTLLWNNLFVSTARHNKTYLSHPAYNFSGTMEIIDSRTIFIIQ